MKRFLLVLLIITCTFPLWGQVGFGGLHVSEENSLLFAAQAESPVYGDYKTLYKADLETKKRKALTFFPERVEYLADSGTLQIHNRFGLYRSTENFTGMKPVEQFPSFSTGKTIETGKVERVAASPNGRYMVYVDGTSHAYGRLKIFFVESGEEETISGKVGRSYDEPSVIWSPDSNYLVYRKQGKLYYYSVDQLKRGEVVKEKFRRIGPGSLRNVGWSGGSSLIYIKNSVVYRIKGAEFFTRSFYSELLDAGEVVGKVPFEFDRNFDDFYVSPDGQKLLLNKGGRNLLLYFLSPDDYLSTGDVASLPYLYLPRNTRIESVLWSAEDIVTVFTGSIHGGKSATGLYRLSLFDEETGKVRERLSFEKLKGENVRGLELSEDQTKAAVITAEGVEIRRYVDWKKINNISHSSPLHVRWKSPEELIIAGEYRTEVADLETGEKNVISLSRAGEYGFTEEGEIGTSLGGEGYAYADGDWKMEEVGSLESAQVAGEDYRVYVEPNPPGLYRNSIMVRNISGYGTEPLFERPTRTFEPFPEEEEPVNTDNFTHGSRIRRREVSLVFNAIDSVEGLTEILTTLKDYDIRSTFFVNGEFVRRNPEAAQEIAESGHEVGSLFYSYFNMTDSSYRIEKDFIKRGLARNEDEFFQTTGSELSLLWHAPYYFMNSELLNASKEMNYTYVGKDVDTLDWVPQSECDKGMYRPSRELVERIMKKKKPGSIIPIRVGTIPEGRGDYLFQYLDLLINGLISRGYQVVPISTLIHHAQ